MSDNKKKGIDLSALSDLNIGNLKRKGAPVESNGQPLMLPVKDVIPDPNQPRKADNPGFTKESLSAFGAELKEEGVKSPISVRSKNADGKYVINHGERRWRGCVMAELEFIPGFIDDEYDAYNQVKENNERAELTPLDMARFIASREELGDTRSHIAKRLGLSSSLITQYASIMSMPEHLRALYDENKLRDVAALYELTNLDKKHPEAVAEFLKQDEITRAAVLKLKQALKAGIQSPSASKPQPPLTPPTDAPSGTGNKASVGDFLGDRAPVGGEGEKNAAAAATSVPTADERHPDQATTGDTKSAAPNGTAKAPRDPSSKAVETAVMVRFEGALYVLRADLQPSALRVGWIESSTQKGDLREVELEDVQIDSIIVK